MKKVYLIHGWDGNPNEGWFPWLKDELKKKKIEVINPQMPDPESPMISPWVNKLREVITESGKDVCLIGHSIGGQAILRFLEEYEGEKFGKVILVAPWTTLNAETLADEDTMELAGPWIKKQIDWERARGKAIEFITIFSKSDPYVPLSEKDIFSSELDAEVVVVDGPGHLGGEDGTEELPEILENL